MDREVGKKGYPPCGILNLPTLINFSYLSSLGLRLYISFIRRQYLPSKSANIYPGSVLLIRILSSNNKHRLKFRYFRRLTTYNTTNAKNKFELQLRRVESNSRRIFIDSLPSRTYCLGLLIIINILYI